MNAPAATLSPLDAPVTAEDAVYLPRVLLHLLEERQSPTWLAEIEGSLVLSDVSGFTPLSEALAHTGREGSERLTFSINDYFERTLAPAREYDGDVLQFAGDAHMVLFTGEGHQRRAVAAALGMQRATRSFPAIRVGSRRYPLSMSVGVHQGAFWYASIGDPDGRLLRAVFGPTIRALVHAEGTADRGQVLFDPRALGDVPVLTEPAPEGLVRAVRLRRAVDRPGATSGPVCTAPARMAHLPPVIVEARASSGQGGAVEGEHRSIAIAFVGLPGLHERAGREGPQAVLAALQETSALLSELAVRHGGYVSASDVDADGVKFLVLFGAPVAQEEPVAAALRLALDLRQRLGVPHRVGVASGPVFVGDVGASWRREYTVMGDPVNLAARLMGKAAPGEVLVAASALAEDRAGFRVLEREPLPLKGKSRPEPVYAVEGERLRPDEGGGGSIIGRSRERARLHAAAEQAAAGGHPVVLLTGEAGIGKSALARDVLEQARASGWRTLHGECHAHTTDVPYAPWRQVLAALLGCGRGSDPRPEELEPGVERLLPGSGQLAPLLAPLANVTLADTPLTRALEGEQRRARTFALVVELLTALAAEAPLALLVEDLHWADSSSARLAEHVARAGAPGVLLCLTSRHEPPPRLELPAHADRIEIGPLSEQDVDELAGELLSRPLPPRLRQAVLSRSEGNPLFAEQLLRAIEAGGVADGEVELPERLEALLLSRIDALSRPARRILRLAAVAGPEFDTGLLRVMAEGADDVADRAVLRELVGRGLLDAAGGDRYRFRHSAIRDAAYGTVLFARRRRLHERLARHVEASHQAALEPWYELLAHHYRLSGLPRETLRYSVGAGDKARVALALDEADEYYRHAMAALDRLRGRNGAVRSHVGERLADVLELRGRHGDSARLYLRCLRSWRAVVPDGRTGERALARELRESLGEVTAVRVREAALCRKLAGAYERSADFAAAGRWLDVGMRALPPRFPALAADFASARSLVCTRLGRFDEAVQWGRRGLELARRARDPVQLAYAHDMLAIAYTELGRLRLGVRHDLAAVRLYEQAEYLPGLQVAHNNLGWAYQVLGDLAQALSHYEASAAIAERVGNRGLLAIVHNNIGEILLLQGQREEAVEHLRATLAQHREGHGPAAVAGLALVNLSRAYQLLGRLADAEQSLDQGEELLRDVGARALVLEAWSARGELALAVGRLEDVGRISRRILRAAEEMGLPLFAARGQRLLGLLAAEQGRVAEAEELLRASETEARRIGAGHEQALALLHLGELPGSVAGRTRALRRAVALLEDVGAVEDLRQARALLGKLSG